MAELINGEVVEYSVSPEDCDLMSQDLSGLTVSSAEESLALIKGALGNKSNEAQSKAADMIALNAGAAIYVSGVAGSLKDGVAMAQDAIGSGLALGKLTELVEFTSCFSS